MKFDTPATSNPIDQLKVVGKPVDRIDGPLKTTGTAPYANDRHDVAANQAHGYIVGSAIAKGRIVSMDLAAAQAAPGVLAIVTAENAGKLGKGTFNTARLLGGPEIQHYHQAIAVVVAETFEQARAAAPPACASSTRGRRASFDLASRQGLGQAGGKLRRGRRRPPSATSPAPSPARRCSSTRPTRTARRIALDDRAARQRRRLERRPAHAVDLEPDDRLDRRRRGQDARHPEGEGPGHRRRSSAAASAPSSGCAPTRCWRPWARAPRAARCASRMPRALIPNNTVHRSATIQRIRIGATRDGKITAIAHESWSGNLPEGGPEAAAIQTRSLYAGPHRMTSNRLAVLDLPEANAMRAPNEAPGLAALEIAMDEMAEKLGMDPIAFRIANDTQVVPDNPAKPASTDPQSKAAETTSTTRIRRSRSASWSNASAWAPGASAGTSATRNPAACATAGGSSAWAWPRPSATTWS